MEKPRANLYNVITRFREDVVSIYLSLTLVQIGFRHCLLVVKLNDFESKSDQEENFRKLFENVRDPQNEELAFKDVCSGLALIVGNYACCVIETQDDLFLKHFLAEIAETQGKIKLHEQSWVLHFTEEVPEAYFHAD
jgi:hypothetical protein